MTQQKLEKLSGLDYSLLARLGALMPYGCSQQTLNLEKLHLRKVAAQTLDQIKNTELGYSRPERAIFSASSQSPITDLHSFYYGLKNLTEDKTS